MAESLREDRHAELFLWLKLHESKNAMFKKETSLAQSAELATSSDNLVRAMDFIRAVDGFVLKLQE